LDVLDDILTTLALRGVLYFRTDFNGPWAVTVPELGRAARFHLVVQGECGVAVAGGETLRLTTGDLVLIPRGRRHVLGDQVDGAAPPLETVLADAGYDGQGVVTLGGGDRRASTQLVCGHFSFRQRAEHPLIAAMPDHLLVKGADRARQPWLDEVLRLVVRRVFSREPGSRAAVVRLSEIVFIELLRFGIRRNAHPGNLLVAIEDAQIGRALALIHARPDAPWTVESLGAEVAMSRSAFAERFAAMVGMGPAAYLAEWRLQRALAMLEDGRDSIQQIAAANGYQSPAAFSRAFSAKFGISPRVVRLETA